MTNAETYEQVTSKIVAQLERGTVPWRRPWRMVGGLPVNVRNGRAYRGINVFLLALEAMAAGYSDPRWGTYKAVQACGGNVRKGEHGSRVILWKRADKKQTAEEIARGEEPGSYFLLRTYTVFNVEQCDGIEPLPETDADYTDGPIERAEQLVAEYVATGPAFSTGGDRAYYSPAEDAVRVPELSRFDTSAAYYQTLYHELTHSTGHESRLGRIKDPAAFGSDPYAREELVAELGASMLAALAGLDTAADEQSAAYVAGWLKALEDDHKLVVQAAAQAQKAADMISGVTFGDDSEPLTARKGAATVSA